MKYNWQTFPKWHDSDTETMKDILVWVQQHKAELRGYIDFVDRASRTHGLQKGEPIEITYRIYKEILGE